MGEGWRAWRLLMRRSRATSAGQPAIMAAMCGAPAGAMALQPRWRLHTVLLARRARAVEGKAQKWRRGREWGEGGREGVRLVE